MKQPGRTLALSAAIALSGAVGAEEPPSAPQQTQTGLQTNRVKDWSQTRLTLEPDLREQIERTKAILDQNAIGLEDEISRLRNEGYLDRRSSSEIRNAMHHAQSSITHLAERIDADAQIDGWTARMTSYELGLAADALAQQADAMETALSPGPGSGDGAPSGHFSEGEQPPNLARTLRESSSLSKETAQSIVRHLQ